MVLKLQEGLQTNNIKFYVVDIDSNGDLCEKCNVTSVPTFILFKDKKFNRTMQRSRYQGCGRITQTALLKIYAKV